jgi:hypothetical protein
MQGYEKVNKRDARSSATTLVEDRPTRLHAVPDPSPGPTATKRPRRRLIDLSTVACESPGESIAHENEIVERIALAQDYAERPSKHCIAEQLQGLVDPELIRRCP